MAPKPLTGSPGKAAAYAWKGAADPRRACCGVNRQPPPPATCWGAISHPPAPPPGTRPARRCSRQRFPRRLRRKYGKCLHDRTASAGSPVAAAGDRAAAAPGSGGGRGRPGSAAVSGRSSCPREPIAGGRLIGLAVPPGQEGDRKSTRLNSSHLVISYAVFCLKKKTNKHKLHAVKDDTHCYAPGHEDRHPAGAPPPIRRLRESGIRLPISRIFDFFFFKETEPPQFPPPSPTRPFPG